MIITIAIEHVTLIMMAISICLIIINTIELSVHEETYIIIYIYMHIMCHHNHIYSSSTANRESSNELNSTNVCGRNEHTLVRWDLEVSTPHLPGPEWTTEEIIANLR